MSKAKITRKLKKALLVVTGSILGLALSLGLVAGPILANSDSEAEQALMKALANGLYENPDSMALGKVADLLIQLNQGEGAGPQVLGLIRQNRDESGVSKTCFKDSDTFVCRAVGYEEMNLPSPSDATTTVSEQSRLTVPYWIDYMMVELEGTVSGSNQGLIVSVGTTTNGFGPVFNASSTGIPAGLIARSHFPTSSQAVQYANGYNYINYRVASGTLSAGVSFGNFNPLWRIPTTTYITAFVQVGGNTSTAGMCDPGTISASCEPVSSTMRGWTGRVIWRYHYRVTF